MSTILNKIASALAFLIGGMAIFAGGKVLLGIDPGYYVINTDDFGVDFGY